MRGASITKAPSAVVVGGQLNGLGVVRSLACGRVPTIIVDATYRRPAMWSRFARPIPVDRLYGRGLVDGLLALQRDIGHRPVLYLTEEAAVRTVSTHREELNRAYRFQLPTPEMITILENKARFHEFAEQNSLPVPRSMVVNRASDLAGLRDLRFPVIVKPADKRLVNMGLTERLHMAADPEQTKRLCLMLQPTVDEFVVQEWIEGDDSNIHFCLFYRGQDRRRTVMFSGRKLLSHPPKAGSTALCTAAPDAAGQLEPFTSAFLDLCEYRGLGSLEFKWDPARRIFVIIEPTVGRTDWQEEIATLNGVNIPLAAYRDLTGLPDMEPVHPRQPVAWQESWRHWRGRSALKLRLRVYDGYWRMNDPIPAIVYYTHAVLRYTHQQIMALFSAAIGGKRRRRITAAKQP